MWPLQRHFFEPPTRPLSVISNGLKPLNKKNALSKDGIVTARPHNLQHFVSDDALTMGVQKRMNELDSGPLTYLVTSRLDNLIKLSFCLWADGSDSVLVLWQTLLQLRQPFPVESSLLR